MTYAQHRRMVLGVFATLKRRASIRRPYGRQVAQPAEARTTRLFPALRVVLTMQRGLHAVRRIARGDPCVPRGRGGGAVSVVRRLSSGARRGCVCRLRHWLAKPKLPCRRSGGRVSPADHRFAPRRANMSHRRTSRGWCRSRRGFLRDALSLGGVRWCGGTRRRQLGQPRVAGSHCGVRGCGFSSV